MISVCGHLVDSVKTWGWPWHGVLAQNNSGQYFLQRHDGAQWPMQDASGPYINTALLDAWRARVVSANSLVNTTFTFTDWGTHLVRVQGNSWQGRTTEQAQEDAARSQEWRDAAMITDGTLYGRSLKDVPNRVPWIFSQSGEVWLMELRIISELPSPGANASLPLHLSLHTRRFGLIGVEGQWSQIAILEAPTCIPVPVAFGTGGGNGIQAQAVRSDGGHVVLEVYGAGEGPARLRRGAYGFYDVNLSRSNGVWSATLALRMPMHEIYTLQVLRNDLRAANSWVIKNIIEETAPYTTRTTYAVMPDPVPGSMTACVGVIEQQQTRRCGWVYDEYDNLLAMTCQIRVVHECDVDQPKPTVGGRRIVYAPPGGPLQVDDDSWSLTEHDAQVTTTLHAEMLRGGVVVSGVSAEVFSRKRWREGSSPDAAATPDVLYDWRVTVGDYVTQSSRTLTINWGDFFAGASGQLWPVVGILSGFFGQVVQGYQLQPWGARRESPLLAGTVFSQQLHTNQSTSNPGALPTLRLGACRLANNVWVPFIQAGREHPNNQNEWLQLTADTTAQPSAVLGLPPTVFGARVGPRNGPAPDAWTVAASTRRTPPPGSYDYLHGVTVPFGHVV